MSLGAIEKEIIELQSKKIGETYLRAKIQMLNELLEEIKSEGYETVNQVIGSINTNIDILNKVKKENK